MFTAATLVLVSIVSQSGNDMNLLDTLLRAELSRESGVVELEVVLENFYKATPLPLNKDKFLVRFKWLHKKHFILEIKETPEEEYQVLLACDGNYVLTHDGSLWEYAFLDYSFLGYEEKHLLQFEEFVFVLHSIVAKHIMPLGGFSDNTYLRDYYHKVMQVADNRITEDGTSKLTLFHPDAPYITISIWGTNNNQPGVRNPVSQFANGETHLIFEPSAPIILPAVQSTGSSTVDGVTFSWTSSLRAVGFDDNLFTNSTVTHGDIEEISILCGNEFKNIMGYLLKMDLSETYPAASVIRFPWSKIYDLTIAQRIDLAMRLFIARLLLDRQDYPGYVWAEEIAEMIDELYGWGFRLLPIHIAFGIVCTQIIATIIWFLIVILRRRLGFALRQ